MLSMRMHVCLVSCLTYSAFLAQAQSIEVEQPIDVLTETEWERVNESVDRALEWLIRNQNPDGSFPTLLHGQPGVTGLCMMAFMAQGHLPGQGKYGAELQKALDYIVSCQKPSGILATVAPNGKKISREVAHKIGVAAAYNHAIAGLVLSECYAMAGAERTKVIRPVVEQALAASYQMQDWPNDHEVDAGGWRYLHDFQPQDSDLSVTGWELMFLRSATNAGFDVERERIERAMGYVRRCFHQEVGTFVYKLEPRNRASRAMAGAGILALAHAGLHETPEAKRAGDWILKSGFHQYNTWGSVTGHFPRDDRYHYGLLTCSQAMYQLGGRYWGEFFSPMAMVLMENQNSNGSWDADRNRRDGPFGKAYTTAIGVLALSPSNQLLPIFQR